MNIYALKFRTIVGAGVAIVIASNPKEATDILSSQGQLNGTRGYTILGCTYIDTTCLDKPNLVMETTEGRTIIEGPRGAQGIQGEKGEKGDEFKRNTYTATFNDLTWIGTKMSGTVDAFKATLDQDIQTGDTIVINGVVSENDEWSSFLVSDIGSNGSGYTVIKAIGFYIEDNILSEGNTHIPCEITLYINRRNVGSVEAILTGAKTLVLPLPLAIQAGEEPYMDETVTLSSDWDDLSLIPVGTKALVSYTYKAVGGSTYYPQVATFIVNKANTDVSRDYYELYPIKMEQTDSGNNDNLLGVRVYKNSSGQWKVKLFKYPVLTSYVTTSDTPEGETFYTAETTKRLLDLLEREYKSADDALNSLISNLFTSKQDKLTAGDNIDITDNVISVKADFADYVKKVDIDTNVLTASDEKIPSSSLVSKSLTHLPLIEGIANDRFNSSSDIPYSAPDGIYLIDTDGTTEGSWIITVSDGTVIEGSIHKSTYTYAKYITTSGAVYQSTYNKAWELKGTIGLQGEYVPISGGTMTGTLVAPIIQTGTASANYFQCQKFRGQGDATKYKHAIDFGYNGHNQVDFYEYGGVYNFWKCQQDDATASTADMVASFQLGYLKERGNTLIYPGKDGTLALTSDISSNLKYYLPLTGGTLTGNVTMTKNKSLILNTDTGWTNSYRAIPFSFDAQSTYISWVKDDATTGLTFNPNTGALRAGSFIKGNGTSAQFLKADGSVDSNTYLVASDIANKVDKVSGKGLSTNDYTTAEKTKLAGIAEKANNYTLPTASSSILGGIKVGDGLIIDSGVLSLKDNALSTVIYFTQQAPSSISSTYVGVYHVLSNINIAGTVTNKSNMAFYSNGTAVNELTIATGRIFTCMDGSKYQATDTGWSLLADSMDVVQETGTSTTNVMSQNAVTLALNNVAIENQWYGVEFDTTVSDPTCTRIGGNMDLHRTLPVQSKMRRCLLSDAGVVQAYLDANDSTLLANGQPADLTGAMGQVMVEMEGYVKYETEGNKRRVKMSQFALDGYSYFHYFISAYKATVQRATLKLASVMNTTEDYRGGNNNADWDGTYRSFLGLPANTISLTNFRAYARNRGTAGRGGAGWNCLVYDVYKTLYWSFVVEYATLNCQKAINSALTSEGYRQGGLGMGLTTALPSWGQWTTYNSNQSTCPCGYTNSLGNNTGEIIYDKSEYDSTWSKTAVINSYRGVECPFGDTWNWVDGILVNVQSADAGGTSKVYVCHDPVLFSSTSFENYECIGEEARSSGYGKTHLFGSEGDMIADTIGGGTSSYLCDYRYVSIPNSGTNLRGLHFSSGLAYGSAAGFSCSRSDGAPSSAYGSIGSRLCFLP